MESCKNSATEMYLDIVQKSSMLFIQTLVPCYWYFIFTKDKIFQALLFSKNNTHA